MKQTCKKSIYLSPLLDGELTEKKAAQIRSHMETCGVCQKAFSNLMELNALLENLPEIDPSPDFDSSFQALFETRDRPQYLKNLTRTLMDGFRSAFWPRFAAAAMVIMLTVSVIMNQTITEPTLEDQLIGENLDFFDALDMIDQLDLLANWDAISEMDENT